MRTLEYFIRNNPNLTASQILELYNNQQESDYQEPIVANTKLVVSKCYKFNFVEEDFLLGEIVEIDGEWVDLNLLTFNGVEIEYKDKYSLNLDDLINDCKRCMEITKSTFDSTLDRFKSLNNRLSTIVYNEESKLNFKTDKPVFIQLEDFMKSNPDMVASSIFDAHKSTFDDYVKKRKSVEEFNKSLIGGESVLLYENRHSLIRITNKDGNLSIDELENYKNILRFKKASHPDYMLDQIIWNGILDITDIYKINIDFDGIINEILDIKSSLC
jgi:hypothetical protein